MTRKARKRWKCFGNSLAILARRASLPSSSAHGGGTLRETNVIADGLHPALQAVGFPQPGMHAFRRGCDRRWELAGMNRAIIRQQMGHSSETMTVHYTGKIPLDELRIVTNCGRKEFEAVA